MFMTIFQEKFELMVFFFLELRGGGGFETHRTKTKHVVLYFFSRAVSTITPRLQTSGVRKHKWPGDCFSCTKWVIYLKKLSLCTSRFPLYLKT